MLGKTGRPVMGVAILVVMTAMAGELGLQPVPEPGVLLLRNGQAIEGKISRVGDLYYVALPNGEIRVKAAEVEFCCRDFEEGYRTKRAAIQPADVQEHLRLAQWCLRHDLDGHAGQELSDAQKAQPTHPMIEVLLRRLQAKKGTHLFSARKAAAGSLSHPSRPSPEDLDRLVGDMPAGSVERFTQTIQPLLANNCMAAACHGPGATAEFRLLRIPLGRPPSRLTTQRNLHATMQWVDRENPAASRLLTAASHPHGDKKGDAPLFREKRGASPFSPQYQRVVGWVYQVAARATPEVPATVAPREGPPVQAMTAAGPNLVFPDQSASPIAERHAEIKPSVEDPFGKTFPRHSASPGSPYVPIDAFDPEIFNRRYCSQR